MKIFLLLLLTTPLLAQRFSAYTRDMYLTDNEKVLSGMLTVELGQIAKTDTLHIYAETGRRFTATIIKISDRDEQELTSLGAGQSADFRLLFTENPSTGKDYLRAGYKVYPSDYSPASTVNATSSQAQLQSTIDGKKFQGKITYKGALYLKKGIKGMNEKPYLQLQFAAANAPDERILTIQIFNPKEAKAKYTAADLEINFSGSPDGNKDNTVLYGFVNGKATENFNIEISKWQRSGNKVIISGKFGGILPEVLVIGRSKNKIRFENAVFEDVELEIFEDRVDFGR
jgi:hypothetical protein